MFERFTDRARKVMALANQEAQRFNHEYIGTEHILLGLVKEGSGVGANVLKNLDVDLRKVRLEVEKMVAAGPGNLMMGKLPQTPRAKKVIEYAIEETGKLNHRYVGTEHLLLGLLREEDGVGAQVLMNLKLKLDEVREEVVNLLGGRIGAEEAPTRHVEVDAKFRDHPVVNHYVLAIDSLLAGKDEAVKNADYERAAQLRDKAEGLERRLRALCAQLEDDPEFGLICEHSLEKYCLDIIQPTVPCVRKPEVDRACKELLQGQFVVIVGEEGAGTRTLIGFIAKELFDGSDQAGGWPFRLLMANHAALYAADSDDGYPEALGTVFEELVQNRAFILVVPRLDLYANTATCAGNIIDAWKTDLMDFADQSIPLLATTTRSGVDLLRSKWPGLMKKSRLIELAELTEEQARVIVANRISDMECEGRAKFESGFTEALTAARSRWRKGEHLADPGRVLAMLEAILAYDCHVMFKKMAPRASLKNSQAVTSLTKELRRMIDAADFAKAETLLQQVRGIMSRTKTVSPGHDRWTVPVSRVEEFLGAHP